MTAKAKALTPLDEFKRSIQLNGDEVAKALPKHISKDKFLRVLQTAATLRPELITADRRSLWGEISKCASDGLIPDGNEATINIYGGKAKYMPMIAGILKKVRNSGLIKHIDAIVRYEHDTYESWVDENGPHFKYMRARGDRGKVLLTFAYATTQDGGFYLEEIDESQMDEIEKSSKAKTGPWKGPFRDEMRRKSALRRMAKRLPSSADVEQVFHRDDDMYDFKKSEEKVDKAHQEGPSRLKDALNIRDQEEPELDMTEQVIEPDIVDTPPSPQREEEPPI